jgi:hypothetical protein
MLQKLADHIAACRARAVDYEDRAAQIQDEAIRADYLEVAKRWNHIAETYEFVESLERFLLDAHKSGWPLSLKTFLSHPPMPKSPSRGAAWPPRYIRFLSSSHDAHR